MEKRCRYCEQTFDRKDPRGLFCSRSCAASFNNTLTPKRKRLSIPSKRNQKRNGKYNYRYSHNCQTCEKLYETFTAKSKFCSPSCKSEHHLLHVLIPKFMAETLKAEKFIRRCVWYTNPHICVSCGVGVVYNNMPLVLQVDHIDGNSDNNNPKNLRLLCPNCHTQTKSYSGANRGSGRTVRKVYRNKLNDLRKWVSQDL